MEQIQEQITICSGSNLAHGSIACIGHHCKNVKINVLTRRPDEFKEEIVAKTDRCIWGYKGDMKGKINKVSNKGGDVIPGSSTIIICSPSHVASDILEEIKDHLDYGVKIGCIYGGGSFDLQAFQVLGSLIDNLDITIFGFQFVPFLCKATKYGEEAEIYGPKNYLCVTSYPISKVDSVCNQMALFYATPVVPIPNFLTLTLTPSNQIIHPGRVYGYFHDWDGKSSYDPKKMPKLYGDLDDNSAEQIQLLDNEIQDIKRAITEKYPQVDLSLVVPIKERISNNYADSISDFSTLKSVFNTNDGYAKNVFPMVPSEDGTGVVLNTECRFFTEDIPFGLCVLLNMGDMLDLPMTQTRKIIKWHQKFMKTKFVDEDGNLIEESIPLTATPKKFGIESCYTLCQTSFPDLFTNAKL